MCIRDRRRGWPTRRVRDLVRLLRVDERSRVLRPRPGRHPGCLLYTSDAADERSSVDLGGRRIIQK